MRSSNKSRSRNKNQNRRTSTNVINRVFDSSGPEGKVRGTPQQIVEKYQALGRDAQLAGDRVAAENFQQHSEHYTRLLNEAMREQNQRREAHEAQQAQHAQRKEAQQAQNQNNSQNNNQNNDALAMEKAHSGANTEQPQVNDLQNSEQPDVIAPPLGSEPPVDVATDTGLVETPEGKSKPRPRRKKAPTPPAAPPTPDADQAAE